VSGSRSLPRTLSLSSDPESTANRLTLAIPCHRALNGNGQAIKGYRWGEVRQRTLIDREVAVTAGMCVSYPHRKQRLRMFPSELVAGRLQCGWFVS
jgi:hypothetical protein